MTAHDLDDIIWGYGRTDGADSCRTFMTEYGTMAERRSMTAQDIAGN